MSYDCSGDVGIGKKWQSLSKSKMQAKGFRQINSEAIRKIRLSSKSAVSEWPTGNLFPVCKSSEQYPCLRPRKLQHTALTNILESSVTG